nr:MurR/RpiR family transcriptional regulator [uncultured Faecalibacillus sp.]
MDWKKLEKKRKEFTDVEWGIIEYIKRNIHHVTSMNIAELASVTYTSNASIIRTCRKLNCSGFKELKQKLVQEIENQKHVKQSVDFTVPFYSSESIVDIISHISNLYKESIDIINTGINPNILEKIIQTIYHANRMFIYSIGDSKVTAKSFINKLIKLNYFAISATDNHEELSISKSATSQDCALFISYSGGDINYLESFQILKRTGCKTMIITANKESRIAKECDYCILLPDMEENHKIATFYSQLAFQYVLNIIYSLLYVKMKKGKKI